MMFPGEKAIRKAEKHISTLENTELLHDSKHIPSESDIDRIVKLIEKGVL